MIHFDFATALVVAAAITGTIWLIEVLWWRKRRDPAVGAEEPVIVDYARSFFPLIILVLVLRSFLGEPFRIPSGSMQPTLEIGDFILVNKFAYGLRLPVTNFKFLEIGVPQRGDVAVFKYPLDTRVDFIKRIIGVPGDHIVYRDKQLYINGELAPQSVQGPYGAFPVSVIERREELIRDVPHELLVMPGRDTPELEFYVPEGRYFVMGDNRDNSNDSREWGMVPEENLVGRAVAVWMSWAPGRGPVWNRFGTRIN